LITILPTDHHSPTNRSPFSYQQITILLPTHHHSSTNRSPFSYQQITILLPPHHHSSTNRSPFFYQQITILYSPTTILIPTGNYFCLQFMDDEKLSVQLNLGDFESMFELKTNEMSEEVRLKKEAGTRFLSLSGKAIHGN
jgi:hypothetical protein